MDNKKTYEKIGEHLNERISKCTNVVKWIKWQLFDILTLWDDEKSRKEVCGNIENELQTKIDSLENIDPKTNMIEKRIANLTRLKEDVEKRMNSQEYFNDFSWTNHINLDRDNNFDNDVLDTVIDSILENTKKNKEIDNDILIKTLLKNDEYCNIILEKLKNWNNENKDKAIEKIKAVILQEKAQGNVKNSNETAETLDSIEFSDSDWWRTFAKYCKEHNISISWAENINYNNFKNFINTNFQYIDWDWFIWKLTPLYGWVELHDDAWSHANYMFEKTGEKIDQNEKIIILWNFDDGDYWKNFYEYCNSNQIIKNNGTTTVWIDFTTRIDANCNYLDKDWNVLKLIPINWWVAWDQNPDGPVARYSFINTGKKYSQTISTNDPEVSTDGPEASTNDPEVSTDGSEASTDGPEASTNDPEVSTDGLEASTDGQEAWIESSEVSTDGLEVSTDNTESLKEQKERVATISNVNQVNRAIAQREADEELRQRYEKSWWNIFDKANLFLRRKFIKDRMVNKKMNWKNWFDWSESGQSAADRHQIEQENDFADRMKVVIQDIDSANYPETRRRMDELLWRLTWNKDTIPPRERAISDSQFQTEFQNILDMSWKVFDKTRPWSATSTNWRPISEIIKKNDLNQLSTNILMQANKFREQQRMTRNIADHIAKNPKEKGDVFDLYCRNEINKYISTFSDIPDFLQQMWVKLDSADATKEIKKLQAHVWALTTIAAQSLKLRIQMIDDWWEAYNVRKEWWTLTKIWRFLDDPTGWENTKFWKWMNKHPNMKEAFGRVWWATKIWIMVTPSFLLAPVWPLAVAGAVWWTSFLTTLFKKKSHYEKEHRSYQRMQATNLDEYRKNREDLANEIAGMKRYEWRFWWKKARDRRQYRDYIKTTQDQLLLSTWLTKKIESRLQSKIALSTIEQTNLVADVADWLARLDYHKETWQNFLWSNNPAVAEKEYRALQTAVMWWLIRLWLNTNDMRNNPPYDAYYNSYKTLIEEWIWDDYNNQGYLKARKKFKRRSNTKARSWAFKSGLISFGLSYLASSLASGKKTTMENTTENMHHGKEWWEYNLWDFQEHQFVSWDLDRPMANVINSNTAEITKWTLYSSVDKVPCSAKFWAQQLAAAKTDLSTALSHSTVSGNSDLVNAINNYVADASSQINAMAWISAWNKDLALARAIEAAKEGIIQPIIWSGNTHISIDPSCLHWMDGWIQNATWAVWQSFRNAWIVNLDFVQNGSKEVVTQVTRAIPIPVWLNTFGSPKWEQDKIQQKKEAA